MPTHVSDRWELGAEQRGAGRCNQPEAPLRIIVLKYLGVAEGGLLRRYPASLICRYILTLEQALIGTRHLIRYQQWDSATVRLVMI